jgi:hypothetical protein
MKSHVVVGFVLLNLSTLAIAADIPAADPAIRAQYVKEYSAACVKGIEDKPALKVLYSHKTVEVYCNCRQRYRADAITQAIKEDRRGKAVQDEAEAYATKQCTPILINQVEHE